MSQSANFAASLKRRTSKQQYLIVTWEMNKDTIFM